MEEQTQCQEHSDQGVDGSELTHDNSANLFDHLCIQLNDILLATDNFSTKYRVRDGINCYYYRAELEHFDQEKFGSVKEKNRSELPKKRSNVLIKRLHGEYKLGKELLFNEIKKLTTCKHPNIVTLVGFCDEDLEMILVFDIPIHETLRQYLQFKENYTMLTWSKRLRICIDVAYGLKYLHYEKEDGKMISHCDIKSTTIIVYENFGAKIFDFSYSAFLPLNRNYCLLKKERDVYKFGALLFDIAFGKLFFDENYYYSSEEEGMASVARRCFRKGILKEMIDPVIKEESLENSFTLFRGPNENSLDSFLKIAIACVEISEDKRPTMKVVVEELEKALSYQENHKDPLRISLEDVKLATENFHDKQCVGQGGFGKVYKGKLRESDHTIVAKLLDVRGGHGENNFRMSYKFFSSISTITSSVM
ncbi:receptor-like protein kinase FERONIA [Rutidosis leptorrhynchoides]|uniref:receptor-like protein kinase FERONIA n=1 Tax=Rutidosis leptorrhynchoides TaxID=125765 RepID=UPI003A9904F1